MNPTILITGGSRGIGAATALLAAMDLFQSEGTLRVATRNVVVDVDPVSLQ